MHTLARRLAAGLSTRSALLTLAGLFALGWWFVYWTDSLKKNQLKKSPVAWFDKYHFLGVDFLHNYHAARHWLNGGNPFTEPFGDPLGRKLCYPPVVIPLFAWCGQIDKPKKAVKVWTWTLAGFAALGGLAAWLARRRLKLANVPLPLVLAVVLTSAPVGFAMERGNYDLLIVPFLLISAWALTRRSLPGDLLAGVCLALCVGLKVYPAVAVAGLVPLRRFRTLACTLAFGAVFVAYRFDDLTVAAENLKTLAADHDPKKLYPDRPDPKTWKPLPNTHSIVANWQTTWDYTKLSDLSRISPVAAAGLIVLPLLGWVGYRVYRCPDVGPLLVPLLLWATALGTFVPKVANDYSLVFLPMAALAVWDRRDPLPVHAVLAFMLLLFQPVRFELSSTVAFGGKVAAVIAVGVCLVRRLKELSFQAHPLQRVGFARVTEDVVQPQVQRGSILVGKGASA
jgi:Glycosyltransferase family 87